MWNAASSPSHLRSPPAGPPPCLLLRRRVREIGIDASGNQKVGDDEQVKREAEDWRGERRQRGDAVGRPCDPVGDDCLADHRLADVGGERAAAGEVGEHQIGGGGRARQRQPVQERGRPHRRVRAERRGREWNEGGHAEQDEVPVDSGSVHIEHQTEERVMILPHDADDREAHRVRKEVRPETHQGMRKLGLGGRRVLELRQDDAKDQERDREREDAVGERLEAPFIHAPLPSMPAAPRFLQSRLAIGPVLHERVRAANSLHQRAKDRALPLSPMCTPGVLTAITATSIPASSTEEIAASFRPVRRAQAFRRGHERCLSPARRSQAVCGGAYRLSHLPILRIVGLAVRASQLSRESAGRLGPQSCGSTRLSPAP
jgi:hypothetical protein